MQKILISIGFAWGIFISKGWAGERCIDVFSNSEIHSIHLKIRFSREEKRALTLFANRMRATVVDRIKARHYDALELLPKSPFVINDGTYHVIEILGAGNEGLVAIAEGPHGPVKVKFFHSESMLTNNINNLIEKVDSLYRPQILDVDFTNHIIVFQITPGIAVGDLLSYGSDLPRSVVVKVLKSVAEHWNGNSVYIYNSILDYTSGKIFLIDPH